MTIQPGPGLPPAIALLLNEKFSLLDRVGARKKLKGMLRDIKHQASAFSGREQIDLLMNVVDPQSYTVVVDGGLDLFSGVLTCQDLMCRFKQAEQVARSIVLMADCVWMHDFLSIKILELGRPTNAVLDDLVNDVLVLHKLRPLIEKGLIRFCPPRMDGCNRCIPDFSEKLGLLTERVIRGFGGNVPDEELDLRKILSLLGEGYLFDNKKIFLTDQDKFSDEEIWQSLGEVFSGRIFDSFSAARNASIFGGSVFSNSKIGLTGLLEAEGGFVNLNTLQAFEGHRAANLPWVSGLSVEQTLHLREEAGLALPRLREYLARQLNPVAGGVFDGKEQERSYIAELREQAAEVGVELKLATQKRPSLGRAAKGIAALGLVVYGFSKGAAIEADQLALIMSMLALLHDVYGHEVPDVNSIKAKPGYVLVAAQDILAHAKS